MRKKHLSLSLFPLFLAVLAGCGGSAPGKGDFTGIYRIIKIEQGDETIETPVLNNIELTDEDYIYRFDKNGDNRFSSDEIQKEAYEFALDGDSHPLISLKGRGLWIGLEPDNYYDLVFRKSEDSGETALFTKRIKDFSSPGRSKKARDYIGEYGIIKIRENGKILNVTQGSRVVLTESDYEYQIIGREKFRFPYQFCYDEEGPYLITEGSITKIQLRTQATFDLLLRWTDQWGNETVVYLKRES